MHARSRSKNRLSGAIESIRERVGRSSDRLRPDDAFLSYYDICLWQEDINCLEDDWLTDNNIAFWEEYLEREIIRHTDCRGIILLRPSMVFMIRVEPNISNIVSALPQIKDVTHIFLPINDNLNPNLPEGGSHWSLLLVSVRDGVAFHYDTLGGSNNRHALAVCEQVSKWIKTPIDCHNLGDDTPQQTNTYDCGVLVCLMMRELLVKRLLNTPDGQDVNMSLKGKKLSASSGRDEMLKIVKGLRRTAQRSQSPGQKEGSPPRIE